MSGALNPRLYYGAMRSNGSKLKPAGSAGIVGGGFSGLTTAIALARSGLQVTLFEEHRRVGWPPHCTGVVSKRVISNLEVITGAPLPSYIIERRYRGAIICGEYSCKRFNVAGGVFKLNRTALEEYLLSIAEKYGAEARLASRVHRVGCDGSIRTKDSTYEYNAVVLAEGLKGKLRSKLGIGYAGRYAYGVNIHVPPDICKSELPPGASYDASYVYSIFSRSYTPGYKWVVPLPSGCIIGVASLQPSNLREFASRISKVYGHSIAYRVHQVAYGGPLLLGHDPPKRYSCGRVVAAGDAAGLAKPLSGGGLYPQSEVARILAETGDPGILREAIATVARRLAIAAPLARLLLSRPDLIRCAILALDDSQVNDADYDNHWRTALRMARQTSLYRLLKCDFPGSLYAILALLRGLTRIALP
jgi:digeranylgeranylglycerophospholipid reductase